MTTFPADPGTWIVNIDPDAQPIPIIGWTVEGHVGTPIVPVLNFTPETGMGYRLPGTGAVVDPNWSKVFESEEAWRAAAGRSAPYEPGELLTEAPAKATKTAPEKKKKKAEAEAQFTDQLSFGSKRLKNRSFWHCDSDNPFVFVIDGGKALPTGENVNKITRDEFYNLRGVVTETVVDPDDLPESDEDEDEDLI